MLNQQKLSLLDKEADTPIKDVVRLACFKDSKVLLVMEADDPNWKLPGGKVHEGETIWQAVEREIHEELGFKPTKDMLASYHKLNIPESDNFRHIFKMELGNQEPVVTSELAQIGYFDLDNLPETKFKHHISTACEIALKID